MIESIKEKVKEKPMTIREFKLERYFARWEFSAPYLLSASDCETMTIGELLELADMPLSALAELRLGYTESQGDPALRAAIARFYPTLAADHILDAYLAGHEV
jgi:aspartate/methionine/tyrosine aminotransferase